MKISKSFRQLVGEIISFVKEDFHPWAYLYSVLFVSALIVVAYGFDGYHRFIVPLYCNGQSWWAMPLIYSAVYFLVAIPNLLIRKEYSPLRNPRFYLKALFFICLMSFAIAAPRPPGWAGPNRW